MRSSSAPPNLRVRSDARLITIFMSDEEAETFQSSPCDSSLNPLCQRSDAVEGSCAYESGAISTLENDFLAFFRDQTIAFSLVGDGGSCGQKSGEAYRKVALGTGGSTASLCSDDVRETIDEIIYAATGLASNYQLPEAPISSTLRVYKDGTWVPRSRENGFDYFAETNTIAFFGSYRPEIADPANDVYGDAVAVSFRVFEPGEK
jgi:hypothetical protein